MLACYLFVFKYWQPDHLGDVCSAAGSGIHKEENAIVIPFDVYQHYEVILKKHYF